MALQHEIARRRPFELPQQEAWLNLRRTAAALGEPFDRLFREHGLREATYNVLRILRGVHREPEVGRRGLRCGEISRRMVTRAADVTRLVDRLERDGLVVRRRDEADRRRALVHVTDAGLERLAAIDEPLERLHREQLAHLTPEDLAVLNDLLVRARRGATSADAPA